MSLQGHSKRSWLAVIEFIALAALFSIVYTQSPLYTSNQNQYFLHGLARAGYGTLSEDWLANTLDPTPLFSFLVEWTYRLTHLEGLFYIYYALLMGVYLISLLGIVEAVFPLRSSPELPLSARYLVYLSLVLLVHSAAWRFALSRTLGDNWSYILEDGVADQRLLGPVLQPSAFGALLLLSIYLFLRGRPIWAAICATAAATLHPTYLLSAAALTAAFVWVGWLEASLQSRASDGPLRLAGVKAKLAKASLPGWVALAAVLPILAYVYLNFGDTPPETTAQAQDILVNFRIPHHALLSWWFDATAVIKIVLVLFALYLVRKNRLFWMVAIPLGVAVVLTLAQVLTGSNVLALLFPWRLSTFLVPLSTVIILAWLVGKVSERFARLFQGRALRFLSLVLMALLVVVGVIRMALDFKRQAFASERPLEAFVSAHRASGQLYLTPTKMQDFRLASGSPAFVDFKSIPYRDSDVLEWYRRVLLADRFYKRHDCPLLSKLILDEKITHVVFPLEQGELACPGLEQVYQDGYFALFQVQSP